MLNSLEAISAFPPLPSGCKAARVTARDLGSAQAPQWIREKLQFISNLRILVRLTQLVLH